MSSSGVIHDLTTGRVPVAELRTYHRNPRRGEVDAIRQSLTVNGQYRPIVVNRGTHTGRHAEVLAGNHTLMAARDAGWSDIAVCWVDVDDDQAARIVAADNRTADLGAYDEEVLAALLGELPDLAGTGYTEADLAALVADPSMGDSDGSDDDDLTPDPPANPVTVRGDVWMLGPHRVICGDCRDAGTVARLLDGAQVNLAFTSPPYADRRKYDESSGFTPIPPDDYVDWFDAVQANVRAHLADDGSWLVNIKPGADGLDTELYVFDLVLAHARRWGWHFATEFCWERNGVPKNVTRRFKNQFEPIYQFTVGGWKMRPDAVRHASDNVPTGPGSGVGPDGRWDSAHGSGGMFAMRKRKNGTNESDVMASRQGSTWAPGEYIAPGMAYPGNRLPSFAGSHQATGHTAAFPVGLPAFFVQAYTDAGDVVYDPFMGSGSTLLAADRHERVAYGCEISPGYVDVICARFQRATGVKPVRAHTGEAVDFAIADDGEK